MISSKSKYAPATGTVIEQPNKSSARAALCRVGIAVMVTLCVLHVLLAFYEARSDGSTTEHFTKRRRLTWKWVSRLGRFFKCFAKEQKSEPQPDKPQRSTPNTSVIFVESRDREYPSIANSNEDKDESSSTSSGQETDLTSDVYEESIPELSRVIDLESAPTYFPAIETLNELIQAEEEKTSRFARETWCKPRNFQAFQGETTHYSDITQSRIGTCYLHAVMASITRQKPNYFRETIRLGDDGQSYDVDLWFKGEKVTVNVTPTFPKSITYFDGEYKINTFWPQLVEKAIVQELESRDTMLLNGYERIGTGNAKKAMQMLNSNYDTRIFNRVFDESKTSKWTYKKNNGKEELSDVELFEKLKTCFYKFGCPIGIGGGTHFYSVVDLIEEENGERYIHVFNPQNYVYNLSDKLVPEGATYLEENTTTFKVELSKASTFFHRITLVNWKRYHK